MKSDDPNPYRPPEGESLRHRYASRNGWNTVIKIVGLVVLIPVIGYALFVAVVAVCMAIMW